MKAEILADINKNKGQSVPLPEYEGFPSSKDPIVGFKEVTTSVGSKVYEIKEEEIGTLLQELFPNAQEIYSGVPYMSSNLELSDPHSLKSLDLAVLPAQIGVAENGACYLDEHVLPHRVLPFICQHLILILEKKNILATMHEAYASIDLRASGFGVFIAGPSKTADIEQSLVIGAQGARSLTICLK